MDILKKYITEAGLISVFIVFCYCVQLAYQAGKLHSFGISEYQGLVNLDFPSVAASLVITTGSVITFLFAFNFALRIRKWVRLTLNKWMAHIINTGVAAVLFSIYLFPFALFLRFTRPQDSLAIAMGYALFSLVIGVVMEIGSTVKTDKKKKKKDLWISKIKSKTLRRSMPYITFLLLLTPLYAYCLGFSIPRSNSFADYTLVDDKEYVIIDFNFEHAILVRVDGKKIKQEYIITKLKDESGLSIKTREIRLDFSEIKSTNLTYISKQK